MKKYLPIILIAIGVIAVILIGVFGAAIMVQDETVLVTSIEFTNTDITEDNSVALNYDDELNPNNEYQLEWAILPEDATNKNVEFISNNPNYVTVSETGLVTFTSSTEGATITIKAKDASATTTYVDIIPYTAETVATSYDAELGTLTIDEGYGVVNETTNEVVLFEGVDYALGAGDVALDITGNNAQEDFTGKLSFNNAQSGSLIFTKDGETHTYTYTVVPFASIFGEGTDLALYNSNKTAVDEDDATVNIFADQTTVYTVGYTNAYQIDLKIMSNQAQNVASTLALTYEIAEYDGVSVYGDYVSVENVDYVNVDSNGDLQFTNEATSNASGNNQYAVKVSATYQPNKYVEQVIAVEEGVNVYTHADLKTAYADLNVHNIILHANIVAELEADQVYTLAEATDIANAISDDNIDTSDIESIVGAPKNRYFGNLPIDGNVYLRYIDDSHNTGADNDIKINGNNYTVTAQDLPVSVLHSNGNMPKDTEIDPITVDIAIFRLVDEQDTYSLTMDIDNLNLVGNAVKSGNTYIAGGYIGIKGDDTQIDLNNTAVKACLLGFNVVNMPKTGANTATECYFKDFYTTSVFVWGSKVELRDSYLRKSGGPLIMVIDSISDTGNALGTSGETNGLDPEIVFSNCNMENWVMGTEPWFVDYGTAGFVPIITAPYNAESPELTGAEGGANGIGQTLLNDDPTYDYFNLIVCMQSQDPIVGDGNQDPQIKVTINGSTAYYPYGLSSDVDPTNDMVPVDMTGLPTSYGEYCALYTNLGAQLGLILGWSPVA